MSKVDGGVQLSAQKLFVGDDDPLLPQLVYAINHASEIEIAVSFIQPSGINLLFNPLLEALVSGASVTILTSDYLDITHPIALRHLMILAEQGAKILIYCSKSQQSFHLKSYIFVKTNDQSQVQAGCAFIGSSNISRSALTNGHEWNVRVDYSEASVKEFGTIRKAFEKIINHCLVEPLTHNWIDEYIKRRMPQTVVGINGETTAEDAEITPRKEQIEALEALNKTRKSGFKRGLVVLATGMGKTWLSAFDVKQIEAKRVLFVAHREEILIQAQSTYSQLLPLETGYYSGKIKNYEADCIFASVQTLGRPEHLAKFSKRHFDYIVIDEFHHASSPMYRNLLSHFEPQFLLGLTATPERTDQADILSLCDNNLVFERNLVQGIDQETLVPFHYYGIWDSNVNYQAIPWRNGRFDPVSLENKFATEKRAKHAIEHWQKYKQSKTLAFCISKKHADFMAHTFNMNGINALSVHSESSVRRNEALTMLENGQVDVLFSVDLFNEGTDLPCIDTILFLRPSESKILFLQQLGRGLRLNEGKTHLVVLDFIGNHHSFLNKPFALFNESTAKGVVNQLGDPNLPEGCFINIDLEVSDFWHKLARMQRTTASEDLVCLAEQLGHLPTVTEFYYHYGDLKKVNKQHTGWFELIANTPDFDKEASAKALTLKSYFEFLKVGIQTTSMTKSFKAILLQAFVALNGFVNAPSIKQLSIRSGEILKRYPNLRAYDLSDSDRNQSSESEAWFKYWSKNPIRAFTTPNKRGDVWFKLENEKFVADFDVPSEIVDNLNTAVLDLTDYLLAQYTKRIRQSKVDELTISEQNRLPVSSSDRFEKVAVLPYFPNLKIACGHFKNGDESDVEYMEMPMGFGKLDPERHFLARASGNSMNGGKSPIIDEQLLLLEWVTPTSAGSLQHATVAIERQDGAGDSQYLLRDVKKQINEYGDSQYVLMAKNPEYEPMVANEYMRSFAKLKGIVE